MTPFATSTTRTFVLPLPPSNNDLVRPALVGGRARLVKTSVAKDWNQRALQVLASVRPPVEPITGPVKLVLELRVKRITSDLNNRVKALEDLLTGHCWHDDCQVTAFESVKRLCVGTEEELVRVSVGRDLSCQTELAVRLSKASKANAAAQDTPRGRPVQPADLKDEQVETAWSRARASLAYWPRGGR